MKYRVIGVPAELDRLIRRRAKEEGKTPSGVALEALMQAFGLQGSATAPRDLGAFAGSWAEDPAVDQALQEQRMVDVEMWR